MASDAKVTVERIADDLAALARAFEPGTQTRDELLAAEDYIRRAKAVLGPECGCGHFEVRHTIYLGHMPGVGCRDCNVMCRPAAGGTTP